MRRRAALKGAGLALLGFLGAVTLAMAARAEENPDGPVGTVMVEPSLTLMGWGDFGGSTWRALGTSDSTAVLWSTQRLPYTVERDAQRYQVSLLAPVSPKWTLGFSYAYTNQDTQLSYRLGGADIHVNGWAVSFRARYWWNYK